MLSGIVFFLNLLRASADKKAMTYEFLRKGD